MPSIIPQGGGKQPLRHPSTLLSRIQSLKDKKLPFIASIYGRPGTGKTRFSCTLPKPLLLICTEDGTASVIGTEGIDYVILKNSQELGQLITDVLDSSESKYKSVVLDNGSKLRDMIIGEVLGLCETPIHKPFEFASRDQWGACSLRMKTMLKYLLDLSRSKPLHTVIIAQEQDYSSKDDQSGSYSSGNEDTIITPYISSAVGRSVCDWLNAEVDHVFQTVVRDGTTPVKAKVKIGVEIVEKDIYPKDFCIRVLPSGIYQAKTRLPYGRINTQEFIKDPTFEKVMKLIEGK